MPDGSEFHTVGAATIKPREAKVVRTRGTEAYCLRSLAPPHLANDFQRVQFTSYAHNVHRRYAGYSRT